MAETNEKKVAVRSAVAVKPLNDSLYWESLSPAELAEAIHDAESIAAEHRANLVDAEGFLHQLKAIRIERGMAPRLTSQRIFGSL